MVPSSVKVGGPKGQAFHDEGAAGAVMVERRPRREVAGRGYLSKAASSWCKRLS